MAFRRGRLLAPAAALVAELLLCMLLLRHDPPDPTAADGNSGSSSAEALGALVAEWQQLVSENAALDGQLSAQCPGHRCSDGALSPWETQSVAALERSIVTASQALDTLDQLGALPPPAAATTRAAGRRAQADHRGSIGMAALGKDDRQVWDLLAPSLDKAAAWQVRNPQLPPQQLKGFSFLDSSAGHGIAAAVAERYAPTATVVSIPSSATARTFDDGGSGNRNSSGGSSSSTDFPAVLHCDKAATVHLMRGLYLSNELFALHWAGEWPSSERLAREGSAIPLDGGSGGGPAVAEQDDEHHNHEGVGAGSAGAGMPSPGQRLAIAMDTYVVVPRGELGWTGQAGSRESDEKQVRQNLVDFAREVGATVTVSALATGGGDDGDGIMMHVHLQKLHRRIQHHFRDPGPEAKSPAEARVIHSRYTFDYDDSNPRQVVLKRLSDGSEIIFNGGRGVTVQSLGILGLYMLERQALFHAICGGPTEPFRLYEDMAPWNLMVAEGRVEYVDSENRDRTLQQYLPTVGALSLYFQRFEEMATILGLCVGSVAGNTPYGTNAIPFVASCMGGTGDPETLDMPCGHSLSAGVPCRSAPLHCAGSFDRCMRDDLL